LRVKVSSIIFRTKLFYILYIVKPKKVFYKVLSEEQIKIKALGFEGTLTTQMDDSKFIDGIFNYCDRWCERCYFTSRCRVFDQVGELTPEDLDISNKKFWDGISKNFMDAKQMLTEAAEKHGIDIEKLTKTEFEEFENKQEQSRKIVKESELGKLTKNYIGLANKWLKNNEHIREIQKDVLQQMDLGIQSDEKTLSYVQTIKDCLEIVQWYLFMIGVKFNRALSGKLEDDGWEEANGFQKDSDGSAKVAIISTRRSFDAWLKLYELLPNQEENLIPILGLLQKILKKGEEDFPNAKNFIRPGFDE
jgi:hypothetical protein